MNVEDVWSYPRDTHIERHGPSQTENLYRLLGEAAGKLDRNDERNEHWFKQYDMLTRSYWVVDRELLKK